MTTTTTLHFNDEKKHSVRYDAAKTDLNAAVSSLYVLKSGLPRPFPKIITITIEAQA